MNISTLQHAIVISLMLIFVLSFSFAQDKSPDTPPKRKGSIKGKVMSDDGQPIEGANVSVNAVNFTGMGNWRQTQTDDEGNFAADEIVSGLYGVYVSSRAYVEPDLPLEPRYYRLGDRPVFTLVKGGVITGRVTNAQGEPMIAAPIRVERVSDLEGREIAGGISYGQPRRTDDRGFYRVYGLPAGRYIVSVAGKQPYRNGPSSVYESEASTFYPSATRDGATEVSVNVGEEVRGIDIRHRGERGHSISGKITGVPSTNDVSNGGIQIYLYRYPGNLMEMYTYMRPNDLTKSFEFFAVADGEYELEANLHAGDDKDSYKSPRRRVTVKGGNVANVELRLMMLGSIEAKIEWEATPEKDRKAECQLSRAVAPDETIIWIAKDEPKPSNPLSRESAVLDSLLNEKGELKYQGLEAATYRFTPRILDEAWYLKAIAQKTEAAKTDDPKSKIQNSKPPDLAKQGIPLKAGEKRKDIILTLANGAASISGRITADKDQSLPSRVRVYLVPAEKESAEDILRYAEQKTKDGTFSFKNFAPGKYFLLARKVADDEPDAKRINPLAWEITTRKTLRAEAEAANQLIELNPCQRRNDYALRISK